MLDFLDFAKDRSKHVFSGRSGRLRLCPFGEFLRDDQFTVDFCCQPLKFFHRLLEVFPLLGMSHHLLGMTKGPFKSDGLFELMNRHGGESTRHRRVAFGDTLDLGADHIHLPVADTGNAAKQYIDKEAVFGSPDYVEWNLSLGYSIAGFDLSLAYSDTDISPEADANAEAVIFSVSRSF